MVRGRGGLPYVLPFEIMIQVEPNMTVIFPVYLTFSASDLTISEAPKARKSPINERDIRLRWS
jgi:hypothetical protein